MLILALVFCFAGTIVDECHDGCRLDVPLPLQPLVVLLCMGKMYNSPPLQRRYDMGPESGLVSVSEFDNFFLLTLSLGIRGKKNLAWYLA